MTTVLGRRPPRLLDAPELLRERLRQTPEGCGVYLLRDLDARVVYVGKAANLRHRLRSYFTGVASHPPRIRQLVERVFDFEVVACGSEREALILENTLIKHYRPRFNVRLKDDKNYLYLKIPRPGSPDALAPGTAREGVRQRRGAAADRAALFPRPYYTRRLARDGARYFGPYTSAQALRSTVRALRTIFPFRTCSDEVFRRGRVCLDYHIHRCAGPCEGHIDPHAYAGLLEQVEMFMQGRSAVLTAQLTQQMQEAAARLDFEAAARYRDRLRAIDRIRERQRAVAGATGHRDVVGIATEGRQGMAAVLAVRDGKLGAVETHPLEGVAGVAPSEVLAGFLGQYYASATTVPPTIVVGESLADAAVLEEVLAEARGGPVSIRLARRGAMRDLVEQATSTAATALRQARIVADFDGDRTTALLQDLQERLGLPDLPRRIECYDISNTMGQHSVGSMVVFEDGRPRPAHYRHFTIRSVEGSNDVASMAETLRRRFGRWQRSAAGVDVPVEDPGGSNGDGGAEEQPLAVAEGMGDEGRAAGRPPRPPRTAAGGDPGFAALPDLLLVDGGRPQLNATLAVLQELGLEQHLFVAALAKRHEEIFLPHRREPVVLPADSPTLFLVQRIRDEAHRFAITRHRARRAREAMRSQLDLVVGVGPARQRALLRHFGSVDAIRRASLEELTAVEGIPRTVAMRIKEIL